MEKKEYIKPSAEVIEMEPTTMFAASAVDIPVVGGSGSERLSNGHRPGRRGEWGNLWAQGEE